MRNSKSSTAVVLHGSKAYVGDVAGADVPGEAGTKKHFGSKLHPLTGQGPLLRQLRGRRSSQRGGQALVF